MTFTIDSLVHILSACDIQALLVLAETSTFLRDMVAYEIRHRLAVLLEPFFGDRLRHWSGLLRLHSAVMSGSVALALFMSPVTWEPGDLDVYVGVNAYRTFVDDLERHFAVTLEVDISRRYPAPYTGIKRVRRYTTSTGKRLEIIQSRSPSAVSPLLCFWSSLVVNFITPHGAVCAYPKSTLAGKGFITEGTPTRKAACAREKYEKRGIAFTEVRAWRAGNVDESQGGRIFSDGPLLVLDFQTVWSKVPFPLPIYRSGSGWVLDPPLLGGASATPGSAEYGNSELALSPLSATSDRSQLTPFSDADIDLFYEHSPATSGRPASVM